MKMLLLLRHAKSDWDDASKRDIERPLAKRGRRDAPRMGRALTARRVTVDYVLCSPATRAKQTLERFAKAAEIEAEIRYEDSIYDASVSDLMKVVRSIPDAHANVLMVGHNPGFENLLNRLTGTFHSMPTAAFACIGFDVDRWEDVEDESGKLLWFLTPKTLTES